MLVAVVVLSLAVYRVTRFLVEDGLIDAQRDWVLKRVLQNWERDADGDIVPLHQDSLIPAWRLKVWELLTCRYCMSVWVTVAMTIFAAVIWSVPEPVLVAFATTGGSMVVWAFAEEE